MFSKSQKFRDRDQELLAPAVDLCLGHCPPGPKGIYPTYALAAIKEPPPGFRLYCEGRFLRNDDRVSNSFLFFADI